jgi:hypothetical protein
MTKSENRRRTDRRERGRINRIVARHMREAAEVDAVGELGATGFEALVAARIDDEGCIKYELLTRMIEEFDQRAGGLASIHGDFACAVVTPDNPPARKPAVRERAEARCPECMRANNLGNSALAPERRCFNVLRAARVAEIGVAKAREHATDRDVQRRLQAA